MYSLYTETRYRPVDFLTELCPLFINKLCLSHRADVLVLWEQDVSAVCQLRHHGQLSWRAPVPYPFFALDTRWTPASCLAFANQCVLAEYQISSLWIPLPPPKKQPTSLRFRPDVFAPFVASVSCSLTESHSLTFKPNQSNHWSREAPRSSRSST